MREKEIQQSIIDAINAIPTFKARVWRNNTGVAKYIGERGERFVRFGIPGAADITGICHGKRIEIEVKRPGKKQTENQISFGKMINDLGGVYFVADSIDSAISQLRNINGKNNC